MISRDQLRQRIIEQTATISRFADENLVLDESGALFWPKQNTLILSDLHFEKASFLNSFGHSLPELDTLDTLERLGNLISVYQPAKVVCLGDSFHDKNAWLRFPDKLKSILLGLMNTVERWIWILGNHDPEIPDELPGECLSEYIIGDISLCHQPSPNLAADIVGTRDKSTLRNFLVFGHFHPKYKTARARQNFSGKCFLLGDSFLVMPSFGSFTGGMWVSDEPLAPYYKKATSVHLLMNAHILPMDLSAA
ncbi:MAG: ligase-associated DNA damage response endonuclease PdeM [Gammaproteobacteria bacterium]|nr:ligase-associated DNA damage response endonuclease PdeM [Gammaproteobacteria bacterium]